MAAVVVAAAAGTALASCQLPGSTYVVTTTADGTDATPGDGICETATGNGTCTVRAAVMEANAVPGTNNIELGDGSTYVLSIIGSNEDGAAAGDLDITESVAVNGRSTIDASGADDRVFDVRAGALILEGPTITGGDARGQLVGGGIRVVAGASLLAIDTTIAGNSAILGGGGIDAAGTVDLIDSTIRDNTTMGYTSVDEPFVPAPGAGVAVHSATLTVRTSSIIGNVVTEVGTGGGVFGDGTAQVVIEGSTISANRSNTGTGTPLADGSAVAAPTVSIGSSTIAGNTGGTALVATTLSMSSSTITSIADPLVRASSATARGTIFATNVVVCSGPITSTGYNLASDASCGLGAAGDQSPVDPLIGPLTDNGGSTPTRLPFARSPAVDAIPPGTPSLCDGSVPTDQRGSSRPSGAGCDIGAVEGAASSSATPLALVIDDAGDAADTAPGDGVCATSAGGCSLRAAIQETNSWPAADGATIAAGVNPVTQAAPTELPAITDDLALHGGGATITGPPATPGVTTIPVLVVQFGTVSVERAHLRGGGGVLLLGGDVTITDSTVSGARGPGVTVRDPAGLELIRGTITGNGIGVAASNTSVSIVQSTIVANRAEALTSAQHTGGAAPMLVVASTISGPADGTASAVAGSGAVAPVRLRGSIVAARFAAPACSGPIVSDGYNVVSDATCGSAAPGDRTGSDPLLRPLASTGGPTPTRQPYANSPAVDAIPSGTAGLCDGSLASDQRGSIRPVGSACDAGSVEGPSTVAVTAPLTLTVTSGLDGRDAAPGDGVCLVSGGGCTLRAAIDESNAWPLPDSITIAPGTTTTVSTAGAGEDANATGDLDLVDTVTIIATGATLDAGGLDRAIDRRSGEASIAGLTVRGAVSDASGRTGAIMSRATAGTLTITGSLITGNDTNGIWSEGALSVRTSSIAANVGAAIQAQGLTPGLVDQSTIEGTIVSYAPLTIRRSTVEGTIVANTYFAGIKVTASTITASSPYGAIITLPSGGSSVTVSASALTNTAGPVCNNAVSTGGYNRVTDASCSLAATGDAQVANLALGPLANNGGPTRTRLPSSSSPLLDTIPSGTAGLCGTALPNDQRGQDRPRGAGCDIGSVERAP